MRNTRDVEPEKTRYGQIFSVSASALPLLVYVLMLVFTASCGKRGDPVAVIPYAEVGYVKDLKVSLRNDNIYLSWGMPEGKYFSEKDLKGFIIFRAEVPEGVEPEKCECEFRSLDFIVFDKKKTFEYLDKMAIKGTSYMYKLAVMDKNNIMGRDSNSVFVSWAESETGEAVVPPDAPIRLVAVYAQKSIVLTWDEMQGKEIRFYRVYRSEGTDFIMIGETVTPVFTDSNIEGSKKYIYRITAVATVEGPASQAIEVETKGD